MRKWGVILGLVFIVAGNGFSYIFYEGVISYFGVKSVNQDMTAFNETLTSEGFARVKDSEYVIEFGVEGFVYGFTFGMWTHLLTFGRQLDNPAEQITMSWIHGSRFLFYEMGLFGAGGIEVGYSFSAPSRLMISTRAGVALIGGGFAVAPYSTDDTSYTNIINNPSTSARINYKEWALTASIMLGFDAEDWEFGWGPYMKLGYMYIFDDAWSVKLGLDSVPMDESPALPEHRWDLSFGLFFGEVD